MLKEQGEKLILVSHLVLFYLNFLSYPLLFVKNFVASARNAATTPAADAEPAIAGAIEIITATERVAANVIPNDSAGS